MNNKFLNRLKIVTPAAIALFSSGCLKTHSGFTDFTKVSDFVILQNGGYSNFAQTSFGRAADTTTFTITVDLASAVDPSSATTVTIAVDPSQVAAYNTYANPQPAYVALPAANFKLMSTTLTVPAGQHYAQTTFQVYSAGLDPVVSYMMPVSIKDGGGKSLSTNQNTEFFHSVGNPLAGTYIWNAYRWNGTTDTTGAPSSTPVVNSVVSPAPLSGVDVLFLEYYIAANFNGNEGVTVNFANNNGALSNFTASMDAKFVKELTDNSFALLAGPVLVGYQINGNAANHYSGSHFRFYTAYMNNAGADRAIIDDYVKQ